MTKNINTYNDQEITLEDWIADIVEERPREVCCMNLRKDEKKNER